MSVDEHHRDPGSAVRAACRVSGLDASDAHLLHYYSNAIYLLPQVNAVARVTLGAQAPTRAHRIHQVSSWLAEQGFPVTRPLPDIPPVTVAPDCAVTFWIYYPPLSNPRPATSADLAWLLRHLHQLPPPPIPLPTWQPLRSLHDTLSDPFLSAVLTDDERAWIQARIGDIRREIQSLDWPLGSGLLHGDAWAGNLLMHTGTPNILLGDWDWVSLGPREVDLIPTWHAATRYGKGPSWIRQFIQVYGYDLATWHGYPTLLGMRDLMQLTGPIRRSSGTTGTSTYHDALRQRLSSLRAADTSTTWAAL